MSRRLFMIWASPIFRDAIHLLLDHPEVEWVGATSNYQVAPKHICELKPDTIVAEEVEGNLPAEIINLLETDNTIRQLISVSLEDNRLRIFSRKNWIVAEAGDLLQLIIQ